MTWGGIKSTGDVYGMKFCQSYLPRDRYLGHGGSSQHRTSAVSAPTTEDLGELWDVNLKKNSAVD